MSRRRFFVDTIARGGASLEGDDAAHLTRVLRVSSGDRYEITDGRKVFLAEVTLAAKQQVQFRVIEELPPNPLPLRMVLYPALVKFDRLEWMIEKATELGVDAVIPVVSVRSEKGLELGAAKRAERWRKIARESGQQSRRLAMPRIEPPVKLGEALAAAQGVRLYLEEAPGAAPLVSALPRGAREVSIFLGPEGGWTDAERGQLRAAEVTGVSVGPTILRAETAAMAALALVLHHVWSEAGGRPIE